jgi:transposase
MTSKAKRAQYTLEFKLEAVRLVKAGQSMAAVAATLGVVEQTLYNWVKADREGKLAGAGAKPVSPELNRPGFELTPESWTRPWRFREEIRCKV